MAQNHPNPLIVSGRYLRAAAGTPLFKKATEYSVRSAGRPHIGGQSRSVSITMLPAAFDEDVKAYGLTAVPFLCFFGGFLVCESQTHLCARAHGRPIMGFFSSFPILLARGELQKKN
ncbi:hypothetical protein EVAR_44587_1 [Eumeta japonica]|uniref:Uncharacterized protein n=1 Tax=Eumeta variegata TaxID=151549 RepID=A0A4C1X7Z4_EUMVA|nr:hypothetical protein EVAR_44587_1 [Eumeta japonica]